MCYVCGLLSSEKNATMLLWMENITNLPIHSLFVGILHTPVDKQTLSWLKAGTNPLSHWNEHLSNVFPRQFWLNLPFSNEREHGFVAEKKLYTTIIKWWKHGKK